MHLTHTIRSSLQSIASFWRSSAQHARPRVSSPSFFRLRLTITGKLLLWSFALLVIFLVIAGSLLSQIRSIVHYSERIVTVHYDIVDTSDELIEGFLTLLEHQRKYEILKNEEDLEKYSQQQEALSKKLAPFFNREPVQASLETLPDEAIPSNLSPFQTDERFISEKKLNTWIDLLHVIRDKHRDAVSAQLRSLNRQGQEAVSWGFVGIAGAIFIGLLGSFSVAYVMNRSAKELKKGIERVGQKGSYRPIRVLSQDELGELASVFNEMAERLKQEEQNRSDFISMLSHEIRTPLTSIQESINLLREEVLGSVNQKQQRFLRVSSQEVERLSSLLKRLMYVSNLDFTEIPIHPSIQQVSHIVDQTLDRLESLAQSKDISFVKHMPVPEAEVLADAEHLQQVMVNLVGNAIKFSPVGGRIWIAAAQDGDGLVRFSVSDEGPGIPREEQKYVFRKYYRGESVRETVDGAGLGLSISQGIVRAHGGEMWLKSESGKGSTFTFTLPVSHREDDGSGASSALQDQQRAKDLSQNN